MMPSSRHPQAGPALAEWGSMPVGAVTAFAGNLAGPNAVALTRTIGAWGWMECDGRALPKASYPELFAFLGYQYGCPSCAKNGQCAKDPHCDTGSMANADVSFNIPDYRGVFLRAVSGGSGKDPDTATRQACGTGKPGEAGSSQADALRQHQHHASLAGLDTGELADPKANIATTINLEGAPQEGITARETRPVNIAVHYLIRFTARPPHLPRRGP
jgi:hypothetical protein